MPIIRDGELYIISHSPEQTVRLGARLGKLLQPGDVVCLNGEMGAGKTLFSKGIGRGWGTQYPVTSPTYTLVHEHTHQDTAAKLYHIDCYRLHGPDDADSIGLDDILDANGLIVMEWAAKLDEVLPDDRLVIDFSIHEVTRRKLMLEGRGDRFKSLIENYRADTFGG